MQPPKRINLYLAPAPPLLSTQVRGQGQASGGSGDLLLHRHLPLQGLKSQFLHEPRGVAWD